LGGTGGSFFFFFLGDFVFRSSKACVQYDFSGHHYG
jgi:hypothetical protein